MQPTPEVIADGFVSLASMMGLLLLAGVLRIQRPRPDINRRFLFAIHITAAIMATRLLLWFTGWEAIGRLTYIAASIMPLAALMVVEALLRRHAAVALKAWAAIGAVVFSLIGLFATEGFALPALIALAAFQALTFIALAVLLIRRDRGDVSPTENTMIDSLGLSLVLILPLAITDFRTEMMDLPVRLSGIAVLALCWLALALRRGSAALPGIIAPVAVLVGVLLAAALAISALAQLDARAIVQVMAIVISAGLLAAVYAQTRFITREANQGALLSALANSALDDHETFLRRLLTSAFPSAALVIDTKSLADFDSGFREHFEHQPIVRSGTLNQINTPNVAEQFEWFFRKFESTHAMLVSRTPFQIMAIHIPALAQSEKVEQELKVAQKLAILLAERNGADA